MTPNKPIIPLRRMKKLSNPSFPQKEEPLLSFKEVSNKKQN